MRERTPDAWGLDRKSSATLECSGPFAARSAAPQAPGREPVNGHANSAALQELLQYSSIHSGIDATRNNAAQILGWQSFAMGVADAIATLDSSSGVGFERILRELVLADVYDQRQTFSLSSTGRLENNTGNASQPLDVEERLRKAARFRDALVDAVCGTVQHPPDRSTAINATHQDHWLEYNRLKSSDDSADKTRSGIQFGHLLAATFDTMEGHHSASSKVHHFAIRWPKLQQALAMLQWDTGSALSRQEPATTQASRPAEVAQHVVEPEPAYWVELEHHIEFPDDQGQTEPAAHTPYRITFADGHQEDGTLDAKGCARHTGIVPGQCSVEYEPDIDAEIAKLQAEIKAALDETLAAERAETSRMQASLDEEGLVSKGLIYTGAAMTGAKNAVFSLVSFLGKTVVTVGEIAVASTLKAGRYLNPLTMPEEYKKDIAAAKQAYEALRDFADEDLETYLALAEDGDSWDMLWDFGADYVAAQHSTEWVEAGGEAVPAVILMLVTAGAGAAAATGSGGSRLAQLGSKVGPKLRSLVDLLKRRLAKKRKSGQNDQTIRTANPIKGNQKTPLASNAHHDLPNAKRFGPANPGPLSDDIANTFRSGTYTQQTLSKDTTLYRVISENGNPAGSYWSKTKPRGALQATVDLAIDQQWGNTATRVVTARVPAGTTIYEGAAAAQRALVGGGNQVYIPRVDPRWIQ